MTRDPDANPHFCPGCGARQRFFPRYPWHFCQACLDRATDAEGRSLVFGNASLSGGLTWAYRNEPDRTDSNALEVVCLIAGRPVLVHEARFGGVVAEPLQDAPAAHRHERTVDLSRHHRLEAARARLVSRRS
ncbi:MAG: ADP-ribosylglycohydrolase [Phyllobacteriaceae bacterium]|nr:ADP-ribosylglycohydrolase [Phyllobacteriaceae bacterium]MBA90791.1 ADP-ribosylglycohydrolase [Phyllobacteriaceae bacterium]